MVRQSKFSVLFAPEVLEHLDTIDLKYHGLIQQTINEQLSYTPAIATRNRKMLEQPAPFDATWELHFGPSNRFRVFYEIDLAEWTVSILAIGIKERNRLLIGGEEFTL